MKNVSKNSAEHDDTFGHYTLLYRDRILIANVTGAIGDVLAHRFCDDVAQIVCNISDKHWGYLGNLRDYVGITESARKIVLKSHSECIAAGCVVDAYTINIAMAASQLAETRKMVGIDTALDQQIFEVQDDAIAFIYKILKKVDAKNEVKN